MEFHKKYPGMLLCHLSRWPWKGSDSSSIILYMCHVIACYRVAFLHYDKLSIDIIRTRIRGIQKPPDP